jgi:hypothetical protein
MKNLGFVDPKTQILRSPAGGGVAQNDTFGRCRSRLRLDPLAEQ